MEMKVEGYREGEGEEEVRYVSRHNCRIPGVE